MECHRCPHREDVEAGKYRRTPFEQTPCAACELREGPAHTIAFDEERGPGVAGAVPHPFEAAEAEEVEEQMPVSVLSDAVAELLSMPVGLRDVVSWRFAGMSYREIGAATGMTDRAAENRLRRAMGKWPALRALFALKAAKQLRRKKPAKSARRG